MKIWDIQYSQITIKHSVERWLDSLDQEQFKSVKKEMDLLKFNGNRLKLPHSKPLGKGIFELRERRYGLRIYYCFRANQIIILLCAGDKTTQKDDIIIANKMLQTIKNNKER